MVFVTIETTRRAPGKDISPLVYIQNIRKCTPIRDKRGHWGWRKVAHLDDLPQSNDPAGGILHTESVLGKTRIRPSAVNGKIWGKFQIHRNRRTRETNAKTQKK